MTFSRIIKQFIRNTYIVVIFLGMSCQKKQTQQNNLQIFRYNESASLNSLDPAFARAQNTNWVGKQLFNGLVQLDDSLHIKPDIASHWDIIEEGKTYVFYLRDDVFFHESELFAPQKTRFVQAEDVVFSFNRLRDPNLASPGAWILQMVDTIEAIDKLTVKIKLKQVFPPFLGLLTMTYASVIPREIKDFPDYNFRSNPIGTGPFYKKYWEENIKLVLRKNKNYHEKDQNGQALPYLEAVNVSFLPDKQAAYLLFLQGKIDFMSGLDPSYKDDILTLEGALNPKHQNKLYLLEAPYLNTEYLGFKMDNPQSAVHDIRVRQALNYGFDRHKLVAYLRNNMGFGAVHGFIPMGMPGFTKINGYDYLPEKAKALWKAYLKENPNANQQILLQTNANYADIGEYLQREWQKVGIPVRVEVTPPAMLRQAMATGKTNFFRGSWIADYPDAENYLSLFYSQNWAPNGPNYTHFSNQMFDELYQQASKTVNNDERFVLYQKMDSIIIAQAPIIPLFYDKITRFVQKNVSGLGINSINHLNLKHVKKVNNQAINN